VAPGNPVIALRIEEESAQDHSSHTFANPFPAGPAAS
jgi:hypothetical protein